MPAYIQQHACRPPLSGMEAVRVQCSRSFGTSFELPDSLGPQGWKEQGNYLAWRLWEYSTVGLLEATSFKLPDSFRPQGWKEQGNYLAWRLWEYSTVGLLEATSFKLPDSFRPQGWKDPGKVKKKFGRVAEKKTGRVEKSFPRLRKKTGRVEKKFWGWKKGFQGCKKFSHFEAPMACTWGGDSYGIN